MRRGRASSSSSDVRCFRRFTAAAELTSARPTKKEAEMGRSMKRGSVVRARWSAVRTRIISFVLLETFGSAPRTVPRNTATEAMLAGLVSTSTKFSKSASIGSAMVRKKLTEAKNTNSKQHALAACEAPATTWMSVNMPTPREENRNPGVDTLIGVAQVTRVRHVAGAAIWKAGVWSSHATAPSHASGPSVPRRVIERAANPTVFSAGQRKCAPCPARRHGRHKHVGPNSDVDARGDALANENSPGGH
eukprot:2616282-Prymnesium_polylepis.2